MQLLCPNRHCLAAAVYRSEDGEPDYSVAPYLLETIHARVASKQIDPWCGICRAPLTALFTEDAPTVFETLDEARPALLGQAKAQARTAQFIRAGRN